MIDRGVRIGMPIALPFQIEMLIVQLKKEHPSWGAVTYVPGIDR